ncbi:MAG: hypothetical protein H0V04_08065 [Chloroflexi bacterium]|nr:hypothetical protein [Chloroflexota bacterium]HEV8053756.1 hypothetical protein [Candidatus Limnocylindrales bacterium]
MIDDLPAVIVGAAGAGGVGVLVTGLLLGIRHGMDWDHIAAIADITSTTSLAVEAEEVHRGDHADTLGHDHPHGGPHEMAIHEAVQRGEGPGTMLATSPAGKGQPRGVFGEQRRPLVLGTLYAIGHALVVVLLGLAAMAFGAALPDWIDPIMSRVVGVTLIILGAYVMISLVQSIRRGGEFRLRSRWMLVFDAVRGGWRRLQAGLHGHDHVDPVEASSYGPRTAFGVGMIHGIGAETASQVLIITAVGGAVGVGLGVPMLLAFVTGLVLSNALIVVITTTGFLASQTRQRLYLVVGAVAGVFSLWIGALFVLGVDATLPDLGSLLDWIG